MNPQNSNLITLTDLAKGFPAMTPVFGATLAEACAVCLSDRQNTQVIQNGNYTYSKSLSSSLVI